MEQTTSPFKNAKFIWGSGAGKGTICTRLATEFNVAHLSIGDLLRDQKANPARWSLIQSMVEGGTCVPIEIIMDIMIPEINRQIHNGRTVFIIDNFPRNNEQVAAFEEQIGDPHAAFYFRCPDETMLRRVLNRQKTSGRVDDNEVTFRKRLQTFYEETMPIINELRYKGRIIEIDSDADLEGCYDSVKNQFRQVIAR
ncbi:hypothetical protein ANOM_008229 [Aspergillus nomiae NRRL 13137]|uniref:Uridylate kinase n=1 Tax=Aspergillus nomiae NRRL (strain ATCC 15546 / NRRL 13137 / CBS 260.88 / M93) TaxID=1509407 RepID=A0A0L1IWH5_ASPN3|nr:uncharacterized protein ANOM_008229 [Aspergillus nomiae NRRL 13137]KNG83765.1 hypothetical protein ANOM_008229 [Aspergillus nomiae NRRL 13137]